MKALNTTMASETSNVSINNSAHEIDLEDILPNASTTSPPPPVKSLGDDPYAYEIRVRAWNPDVNIPTTDYSDTLIMIDTPITQASGVSTNRTGIASLNWNSIEGAQVLNDATYAGGQYQFVYRRMGGDHTEEHWDSKNYLWPQTTPMLSSRTHFKIRDLHPQTALRHPTEISPHPNHTLGHRDHASTCSKRRIRLPSFPRRPVPRRPSG